jgi:hypothetical protein
VVCIARFLGRGWIVFWPWRISELHFFLHFWAFGLWGLGRGGVWDVSGGCGGREGWARRWDGIGLDEMADGANGSPRERDAAECNCGSVQLRIPPSGVQSLALFHSQFSGGRSLSIQALYINATCGFENSN